MPISLRYIPHPYAQRLDRAMTRIEAAAGIDFAKRLRAFEWARKLFQATEVCHAAALEQAADKIEYGFFDNRLTD